MALTNKTKELLAGTLNGESLTAPEYIAWGSDGTTAAATDTSLGLEIERNICSVRQRIGRTVEFVSTLLATEVNGSTLREVGLLNASSAGDLFARDIYPSIEKNNTFEIQSTYFIKVD
jgi:hypothetical protein